MQSFIIKRVFIPFAFVVASTFFMASADQAAAQQPQLVEKFNDWVAYSVDSQGSGRVCYVASQPKEQLPAGANRDPVFFMVSNWVGRNVRNEASIIIGYPFAENASVTADVDGEIFTMFTKGDGAWMENVADETRLVNAMKAGRRMIVKGRSARGTNTTDTYSLSGITAALNKINSLCG